MKVTRNTTNWRSSDILKIAHEVARVIGYERTKQLKITVIPFQGGCLGYAYYNRDFITLKLRAVQDHKELAHTISHEMGHCVGMKHKDMKNNVKYDYTQDWKEYWAWADTFELRKKAEPKKIDKLEHSYQLALKNLTLAATRFKRAMTLKKKWEKKVRHYELRAAARKEQSV